MKSKCTKNKNEYSTQPTFDWAYDLYLSQSLWLRRSLFGLVILSVLLCLSLSANLLLIPLKEKVPYLYAFDQASGEITKIGELQPNKLSGDWALSRYLLTHYVMNYESYHIENLELPYQLVWAQSSEEVKKHYEEKVKSTNPQSPYRLYAKDKYITVRVISINKLNKNTVDIKFQKTLHDRATSLEEISYQEAILKWEFSTAETSQKMLDRDPLGFKVTYYQSTQVNTKGE